MTMSMAAIVIFMPPSSRIEGDFQNSGRIVANPEVIP
jgi:hypothetical protein